MGFNPEPVSEIDDNLRLFIVCVERGQIPPLWLSEFMADGAREFLKGGKPWQKEGTSPEIRIRAERNQCLRSEVLRAIERFRYCAGDGCKRS